MYSTSTGTPSLQVYYLCATVGLLVRCTCTVLSTGTSKPYRALPDPLWPGAAVHSLWPVPHSYRYEYCTYVPI